MPRITKRFSLLLFFGLYRKYIYLRKTYFISISVIPYRPETFFLNIFFDFLFFFRLPPNKLMVFLDKMQMKVSFKCCEENNGALALFIKEKKIKN